MFNNGGMVPPTPKASGILASSPSLVDAVSNDALSDMGGGTLSMAQGGAAVNMQPSYIFNEGGIAKFGSGGVNNVIAKILNGTANANEIRAVEQSSFIQDPKVAQAIRLYKGTEKGGPLPLRPDINVADYMAAQAGDGEAIQNKKVSPKDLSITKIEPVERVEPINVGDGFGEEGTQFQKDIGPKPINVGDGFGEEGTQFQKDIGPEATGGVSLMEDDLDLSRGEAAAKLRSQNPQSIFNPEEEVDGVPLPIDTSEVAGVDQDGNEITVGEFMKPVPGANTIPGSIDEILQNADDAKSGMGAVGDAKAQDYLDEQEFKEFRKGFIGETEPSGSTKDSAPADVKAQTQAQTQADAVAKVFKEKKVDETGQERPKTKEEFVQDFKESMPEYKGMTEAEKGFAIAEAGLRVMAGESPDAVKNIADGMKGVTAEFVKDEKAKRAFNQQIDLSAAKYALTGMEKLRTEALALAKEGRVRPYKLVATENFVYNGKKIKKGQAFPLTNDQINAGALEDLPVQFLDQWNASVKAAASALKGDKASSFSPDREKYQQRLTSLKSGIRMKALLRETANLSTKGNIMGTSGFLQNALNSSLNAMGIQENDRGKFLKDMSSTDMANYNAKQKRLGVLMATKLLKEGSKTLSDFDRKRVDELIAVMTGAGDSIFASESVVRDKLISLEQSIDDGLREDGATISGIELQYRNEITKGQTRLRDVLSVMKKGTLSGAVGLGDFGGARVGRPVINVLDIWDVNTGKLKPSYTKRSK
jgi:hypothetical protein